MQARQFQRFGTLALVVTAGALLVIAGQVMLLRSTSATASGTVGGVVVDASGPVEAATVRLRAAGNVTYTPEDGQFTLSSLVVGQEIEVTAWASGYYVASSHVPPPSAELP